MYSSKTIARFADALQPHSAMVVPIPLTPLEATIKVFARCDCLILPGSPSDIDPQRYGMTRSKHFSWDGIRDKVDVILLDLALLHQKPVLGVCHGLQAINVHAGGTLIQDIDSTIINHAVGEDDIEAHGNVIEPSTLLAAALDTMHRECLKVRVNSNHHQAVLNPGAGLRVSARSTDGVIEAIESTNYHPFLLGVQWHPEGMRSGSVARDSIFQALTKAAR